MRAYHRAAMPVTSKLRRPALAALVLAGAVASLTVRAGADDVKEADRTCYTATAVLLTGDGNEEASRWTKIREVLASDKHWTEVDRAPENRVGEAALTRFDIRHTYQGGPTHAYTVQCGHGGTCNDIARKFREKFPQFSPAPVVQCGDVSNMLTNPTPAGR